MVASHLGNWGNIWSIVGGFVAVLFLLGTLLRLSHIYLGWPPKISTKYERDTRNLERKLAAFDARKQVRVAVDEVVRELDRSRAMIENELERGCIGPHGHQTKAREFHLETIAGLRLTTGLAVDRAYSTIAPLNAALWERLHGRAVMEAELTQAERVERQEAVDAIGQAVTELRAARDRHL